MMFKEKTWSKFLIFSICIFLSTAFVLSSPSCKIIDKQQLYKSLDTFSNRISYAVANTIAEKEYVISPFSIHICMAMNRMGATKDTAKEIDQALALTTPHGTSLANAYHAILESFQKSLTVTIANKFYVMQGYETKKSFGITLSEQFYSAIETINFGDSKRAAKTINDWMERKTNNLITNLVAPDSLNNRTRLVLVNAIHFSANWLKIFNKRATKKRNFSFDGIEPVEVNMMSNTDKFKYEKTSNYQAVQLPYADSNYSMLIILPNSRSKSEFADLERKLQNISLPQIVQNMTYPEEEIKLFLPKFKTGFEVDLIGPLENMGIKRLFTNNAELGNMLEHVKAKVSKVIHKAVIEVNEDGTEAAAGTYSVAVGFLNLVFPIQFNADHPFFYAILYDNKIVLFQGKQTFGL